MRIVNVKCPGCGASIQLDADRETGFCSFCGSTVKVQEAIQKIKFDNTDLIKNNLILAETALESKEYEKCVAIADRVLEADTNNSKAWLLKLKGLTGSFKVDDTNIVSKVQVCLNRLMVEQDNDIKNEAIGAVLGAVVGTFIFCANALSDTRNLMSEFQATMNGYRASQVLSSGGTNKYMRGWDHDYIMSIYSLDETAMRLYMLIPRELVKDESHTQSRINVLDSFTKYYTSYINRVSLYKGIPKPDSTEAQAWLNSFDELSEGLPDGTITELKGRFQASSNANKKGCAGMLAFLLAAGIGSTYGVVELIKTILV